MPVPYIPFHSIRLLLLLIVVCLACGCSKDDPLDLTCEEIASGTVADLTSASVYGKDTIYITGALQKHGVLLRSVDNGNTWNLLKDDFPYALNDIAWLNKNRAFAAADSFNLYETTDGGNTWSEVWLRGTISMEYQNTIYDIEVLNDSTIIFCGGKDFGRGVIGRSDDSGVHWVFTQLEHEMRSVRFTDDKNGVCCGYGALFYTNDGGQSWLAADAQSQFWTGLVADAGKIYSCSFSGSVLKNDGGNNWYSLNKVSNAFRPGGQLNCISSFDGNIFSAGLNGAGVFLKSDGSGYRSASSFDKAHVYATLMNSPSSGLAFCEKGRIFRFSF